MRSKRCGRAPRTVRRGAFCAGLVGLLATLSGCASEPGTATSSAAMPPMHMAGVRVQIEADGLPAQLAPRKPMPIADDPREPWSPNYGSVRPTRTSAVEAPETSRTLTVPVRYARPIDAEDIIRRAVAAHEMRQED
jgi:hypothetical protein